MKSVFIRGQRYEERFLLLERKLESCEMNFLHGHRRSRRSCLQIKEKVVGKLILKRNTQILGRSLGIAESKGWRGEGQDQELISTKTIPFELLSLPPSFPHPFQNRKCEKMIFWGKKRKKNVGYFLLRVDWDWDAGNRDWRIKSGKWARWRSPGRDVSCRKKFGNYWGLIGNFFCNYWGLIGKKLGSILEKKTNWEISVDAFSWNWYEESFWKGMFGD